MNIRYKILEDREKRINLIQEKLAISKNIFITIKANICGDNKNLKETNILLPFFLQKVIESFQVVHFEKIKSYDGNYYIVEIIESDYVDMKKKLIEIESTKLGRFIDLDLYNNKERSISRSDLQIATRKCIICNDEFSICSRLKKHTVEEVVDKTKELVKQYFVEEIVGYVKQSLLEEVTAHPKFGLVTKKSSGKHKDMDYNTFVDSINALSDAFYEYAYEGLNINGDSFHRLREIGIKAEKNMFQATKGINTHKGIIFIMGLLIPSIVDSIYNNKSFLSIKDNIKFLSASILEDFENIKNKTNLTYGEKVYLKYGITGIRGVVGDGMSMAFELCGKFKNNKDSLNNLVINLLLYIMSELDDTVILHNNDITVLDLIKEKSKVAIKLGGYSTVEGKSYIDNFTEYCIKEKISPGGSADMVSAILVLMKVERNFYKEA